MGHSSSKNAEEAKKYGDIYYKLDESVMFPGDTITGTVFLNLSVPYPGDKLCFKFKGEEYTKWVDREARTRRRADGSTHTHYINVTREGNRDIICQEITIYDWKDKTVIPPGQYAFPVSFMVPHGLPGSFFMHRGRIIAEIGYKVTAYLKPEKADIPKIKDKKQVVVRANNPQNSEPQEVALTKAIKTCCCLNKGTINMKTAFEKSAYAPGEEAKIITQVDNSQCTIAVNSVRFNMVQHLHLRAGIHQKHFIFVIKSLDMGGAQPGEKCVDSQAKTGSIILPQGQEGTSKGIRGDVDLPENSSDLTQIITPSTRGQLVQSEFVLDVTSDLDGCICRDTPPTTSLPIQIYSSARLQPVDPMPPMNWQPQPMPMANLTIQFVQSPIDAQDIHIGENAQPNQNQMMQPSMNMNYSQPQPNYNTIEQPNYNTVQQPNYNAV